MEASGGGWCVTPIEHRYGDTRRSGRGSGCHSGHALVGEADRERLSGAARIRMLEETVGFWKRQKPAVRIGCGG